MDSFSAKPCIRRYRSESEYTVTPNLIKPFCIAGFIAGEIYMLLTILAPPPTGPTIPWESQLFRVLGSAFFFGPFGAAAGTGIALVIMLVIALLQRLRRRQP